MNKLKENLISINKNKFFIYLFIFFITISWFIFTHITTLINGDDIGFMHFSYDLTKRIESLSDVIKSQYYQYFMWGGRTIINATAQIFYMFDKIYFDIFNAIIFAGTIYLIYSFRKNKENNLLLLIFIFLSFWFFCGDLYRIFIWEVACFNYGWQAFFSLLFLRIFFNAYNNNNSKTNSILLSLLFFIYSFLIGWGHEAIAPVVFLAVLFSLIYKLKNKNDISKLEIFGFIGFTIGLGFLILAPGNFVRFNAEKDLFVPFDFFPLSRYIFAFFRNGYFLIHFTMPVIVIMILVLVHSYKLQYINNSLTKEYKLKLFYYLFLLFFASFFTFVMLSYANSIIITSLIIMLIIICRYLDYDLIEKYIEYFFIITLCFLILFICQCSATVYYTVVKGKIIEHGFKLVS